MTTSTLTKRKTEGAVDISFNRLLGTPREKIGLNDRDGRAICEGDIVQFVVNYDYSNPPEPTYDTAEGTTMNDTVKVINGVSYFWCEDVQGGSLAWRHNKHCRVIGSIYDQVPNAARELPATGDSREPKTL